MATKAQDADFDDLLSFLDEPTATKVEETEAVPETFQELVAEGEKDEVAALKQELAELKALLSGQQTAPVRAPEEPQAAPAEDEELLVFHVEADGFTAFEEVWTRGTEFNVVKGSEQYNRTLDRNGNTWLDHIADEEWQYKVYGRIVVAPGPFRAKPGEQIAVVDAAPIDYRRRGNYPFTGPDR